MATFSAGDIEARATLDRTPFQRELDAATREGVRFSKRTFTATLDANSKPFYRAIKQASEAGQGFARKTYTAKFAIDRSQLARDLRSAEADVKRFNRTVTQSRLGLDTQGLGTALKGAERMAASSGITVANNFSSPLRKIRWPAIFAGLTAAISAAPSGLVALGGAAASLVPAFVGPIQALSAFNEAQDAVEAGAEDAGEKLAEYERELAKLTPAAQQFVRQAAGMRHEITRFSNEMQSRVLPGFTMLLEGLESAAPALTRGVGMIGSAIGGVAARAGELVRSPLFQGQLERSFANTVPVVTSLGNLLVNLFRDVTNFTAETREMGLGLAFMIDEVSGGFTRFFNYLQPQSAGLGRTFAAVGGIVGDLTAGMGRLFASIGGQGAGAFESLRMALQHTYDLVLGFVEGAMPGFSTAISGALSAMSGFISVLSPLAPLIGTITGSLAPFLLAMKAIDMITFGRVSNQFGMVKSNIAGTTGVASKAGTAIKGLASFAFGPAGIAAGVLGTALMILGQRQQEAAQHAAEHKQQVRTLSEAIIQDAGVIGEATRATVVKSLADQEATKHAQALNLSMGNITEAALGNKDALSQMTWEIDKQIEGVLSSTEMNSRFIDTFKGLSQQMVDTGEGANSLIDKYSASRRETVSLTDAERQHMDRLLNLKAAMLQNAQQTQEAARFALELKAAENGVTLATLEHYNAIVKLNSELLKQVGSELSVREASLSLEQAQKSAAEALREHGASSLEYRQAAASEERQTLSLLQAKYDHALATSTATGEEAKNMDATRAQQRAAIDLASAYKGQLSPTLSNIIGKMDASSAAALGLKRETNKAGEAVYKLPNGKTVKIQADTSAFWNRFNEIMNAPMTKYINIVPMGGVLGLGSAVLGANQRKDGGLAGARFANGGETGGPYHGRYAFPSGGQLQGPGGTRQDLIPIWASNKEFIVNAKATDENLSLLHAINSGKFKAEDMRAPGLANGGMVAAAQEMLKRLQSGGQFFEDFSFYGNSDTVRQYNDQIAKRFGQSTGWDFGASGTRGVVTDWLTKFIASQQAQAPKMRPINPVTAQVAPVVERAVEKAVTKTQESQAGGLAEAVAAAISAALSKIDFGSVTIQTAPGESVSGALDEVMFRSRHSRKGLHG